MDNISLYTKLATLPDNIKLEVSEFIDTLVIKAKKEKKAVKLAQPKFGSAKGMFKMRNDFDEPLDDFKEYMQ